LRPILAMYCRYCLLHDSLVGHPGPFFLRSSATLVRYVAELFFVPAPTLHPSRPGTNLAGLHLDRYLSFGRSFPPPSSFQTNLGWLLWRVDYSVPPTGDPPKNPTLSFCPKRATTAKPRSPKRPTPPSGWSKVFVPP